MTKPKFIQIKAMRHDRDYGWEEADTWRETTDISIYKGEPGAYEWVADFDKARYRDALCQANNMAKQYGADVERCQFDLVFFTKDTTTQEQPIVDTKNTPHPHAALMAEYAKDAAETSTPWERWEVRTPASEYWVAAVAHPEWNTNHEYRRKPQTITVNGFTVPKPMATAPARRASYYLASLTRSDYYFADNWSDTTYENLLLERGLIHATQEAAIAHAKAMLGIDPNAS